MPWCCSCKEECQVIEVDFGIGAYEYWGAKGVDIQIEEVSSCCEEDWTDEPPEGNDDEDEEKEKLDG
jgi:hypothetical protein